MKMMFEHPYVEDAGLGAQIEIDGELITIRGYYSADPEKTPDSWEHLLTVVSRSPFRQYMKKIEGDKHIILAW